MPKLEVAKTEEARKLVARQSDQPVSFRQLLLPPPPPTETDRQRLNLRKIINDYVGWTFDAPLEDPRL